MPIREADHYGGQRVTLTAFLGNARIPLQVDIGVGDAVVPRPVLLTYPTILGFPAPTILAYRREVVVAEKCHALVVLGIQNSRMKDLFDMWLLASRHSFDGQTLLAAMQATFKRRQTALPSEVPLALTDAFAMDPVKQTQWAAFLKRSDLTGPTQPLSVVIRQLNSFLWPLLEGARDQSFEERDWSPGGPWSGG